MNPLKTVWMDLVAEGMRCSVDTRMAVLKDKPDDLNKYLAGQGRSILGRRTTLPARRGEAEPARPARR